MKPATRERMARVLLAALLNSKLPVRELRELADEMSDNPSFLMDFSTLFRESIDWLSESGPKWLAMRGKAPIAYRDVAYSIIQRRRLSKNEILGMIATISSVMRNQKLSIDSSMREILARFFSVASAEEVEKFMNLIQSGRSRDAYLRGIVRKD